MILQDAMTSLNPVLTVGRQLAEGLKLHLRMTDNQAKARADQMLELAGIPMLWIAFQTIHTNSRAANDSAL